jgi:2',3'-cyclic-nucleotide 2'-phosphodiesterase (5'-nucleotidase family)
LQEELRAAAAKSERVVVLSHVGVAPGVCTDDVLAWDYPEVLAMLHGAGDGVVVAVLTGHDHPGGYTTTTATDATGLTPEGQSESAGRIHHLTFRAPLETPPPDPCHGIVEVN